MLKFIAISILYIICGLSGGISAQIVDHDTSDMEPIATALCNENILHTNEIGHISTIGKLKDYFGSLPPTSGLVTCRNLYLSPLQELHAILESSSGNDCSKEKVELISEFHWRHIIASLSRRWRKSSTEASHLPEPLRVFFLHYANEIAEQCKITLPERLEAATAAAASSINAHDALESSTKKLDGTADELGWVLVPAAKVRNYDNFLLLWDQVLAKERRKGELISPDVDELTGEPIIGLVKTKDPANVWAAQRKCRHELRPTYAETVLPIMKLFDLGYGTVDERTRKIVAGNKLVGYWYSVAQVCELLVPLNYYRDESVKQQKSIVLSAPEDAQGLARSPDVVPASDIPSNTGVKPYKINDFLISKSGSFNGNIVKQVKGNLRARSRVYKQFFKNVASNMKGEVLSRLKKVLFISRKSPGNRVVEENGHDLVHDSKNGLNSFLDDNDDDDNDSMSAAASRSKRSPSDKSMTDEEKKAQAEKKKWSKAKKILTIIGIVVLLVSLLACSVGVTAYIIVTGGTGFGK